MRDEFIDDDEGLFDDNESEDIAEANPKASRAWRSIERLREMRELRKHLDDFLYDEIPERDLKDLHL